MIIFLSPLCIFACPSAVVFSHGNLVSLDAHSWCLLYKRGFMCSCTHKVSFSMYHANPMVYVCVSFPCDIFSGLCCIGFLVNVNINLKDD